MDKQMTIKDIAKESGYAVGTVSRVLNNQENVSERAKERILEVVNKYNFTLNNTAKNLKQQFSKNIVVLVKGINNRLFAGIIENLQNQIEKMGFYAVMDYFDEDENEVEKAIIAIREKKPQGIIFLGGVKSNFEKSFDKINVPCVLATNTSKGFNVKNLSSVSIDDKSASYEAIQNLIDNGHKKIGIIGGKFETSDISQSRFEGVKACLNDNGIKVNFETDYAHARFSFNGGYKGMKRLLEKKPDLTAVFAMSDVMAIGAIRALKDLEKDIPKDVSIIGFDGIDFSEFIVPRLTSIKQDEISISEKSVQLLMKILKNNENNQNLIVSHNLIVRESVSKIN